MGPIFNHRAGDAFPDFSDHRTAINDGGGYQILTSFIRGIIKFHVSKMGLFMFLSPIFEKANGPEMEESM